MVPKLRLMCILAHPDDESLGTGGVLARYSNEGVETFVVSATRGEKGRCGSQRPGPDKVGRIRELELRRAASVLGVKEVNILGYRDGELDQAESGEVVWKITHHLRRIRPDVVITFAPEGAYGHPDHIAISQFTMAAVASAADPEFVVDGLSTHRVSKVYFMAWGNEKWSAYQSALKRLTIQVDGLERQAVPWPDWAITTRIDTSEFHETVWKAVCCHKSQMAIYKKLAELTARDHKNLWGSQEFYRVFSLVNGGREIETDLFAGLRTAAPGAAEERVTDVSLPMPSLEDSETNHLMATSPCKRRSVLDMPSAQFRRLGRSLVDQIADFLTTLPSRKVTIADSPTDIRKALREPESLFKESDPEQLLQWTAEKLFHASLHNGHPRFWGYITSSAAPIGMLGDFLAAAVNSNVGAWKLSPFASEMEAEVIREIAELLGYPPDCGGLLLSGGNMANFVGFLAARFARLGPDIRTRGVAASGSRLRLYVSQETHTWVEKAADMAGLGTESIRWIKTDARQRMDPAVLERQIQIDVAKGDSPLMVVGTAGTVGTGAVDRIFDLAGICKKYGLWLHIDGAYGAPAALIAEAPTDLRALHLADSVAVDPHKWLYAPLEAGCVLIKDKNILRDTFSYHPPYYHFDEECTNYFDYGPQNSRGFRALKVWLVLRSAGRDGLREMISEDIRLAQVFYRLAEDSSELEALTSGLSITTFRYVPKRLRDHKLGRVEEYLNRLNRELLVRLEKSGEVFLSNAVIEDKFALRLCVVNFRSSVSDIQTLADVVIRLGRETDRELRSQPQVRAH